MGLRCGGCSRRPLATFFFIDPKSQSVAQIIFLNIVAVFSVPLGAFSGMPFSHTLRIATGLLPITYARVRHEPFLTDSTWTLFTFSTAWHRFLQVMDTKR
jgi:hypothetical protein